VLKIWNGILNFYDQVRDRNVRGSESDKDQGKNPKILKILPIRNTISIKTVRGQKDIIKKRTEEEKKRTS
jgi:hypothetical protein